MNDNLPDDPLQAALDEIARLEAAASAMLAALKELRANSANYQRGQIWHSADHAIHAAEAAGIKEDDR
jgi:hypothetical protein